MNMQFVYSGVESDSNEIMGCKTPIISYNFILNTKTPHPVMLN